MHLHICCTFVLQEVAFFCPAQVKNASCILMQKNCKKMQLLGKWKMQKNAKKMQLAFFALPCICVRRVISRVYGGHTGSHLFTQLLESWVIMQRHEVDICHHVAIISIAHQQGCI